MMGTPADMLRSIRSLATFIDESPSPAHAVESAVSRLIAAGALELDTREAWPLEASRLYYLRIAARTVIAFRTPVQIKTGTRGIETGFTILGAHTDSPCLRIKERSVSWEQGLLVSGTEPYGGLIQSTWLDRDLQIAGAVAYRSAGVIRHTLVKLDLHAVIPNLAIHLNREINKGVEYNPQTQLRALVRVAVPEIHKKRPWEYITADKLGIAADDILSLDLYLSDAKPVHISAGDAGAGVFSAPRIDNLSGSHAVLEALIAARPSAGVQLAALFDHEEIGSRSAQGADSGLLPLVLERIWTVLSSADAKDRESWFRALSRSWIVSVDAAHARHPNYPDKHDADYAPLLNEGIVLKSNVNHRYATQTEGAARFTDICSRHGVPVQRFTNRADMGCGSTIGPLSTSLAAIPGIDIGIPMLAMHSAREFAGTADHGHMIRALTAVLEEV